MRPLRSLLFLSMLLSQPLAAALPVGTKAPDFKTTGAIAGKPFKLHMKDQLRHGTLVLYFFPKAFTQGCTLEAKAFADAMVKLDKGKMTEAPVRSRFGYHVIMLDDVRAVSFPKIDQVRQQIQQGLVSQRVDAYLRELRGKAKID